MGLMAQGAFRLRRSHLLNLICFLYSQIHLLSYFSKVRVWNQAKAGQCFWQSTLYPYGLISNESSQVPNSMIQIVLEIIAMELGNPQDQKIVIKGFLGQSNKRGCILQTKVQPLMNPSPFFRGKECLPHSFFLFFASLVIFFGELSRKIGLWFIFLFHILRFSSFNFFRFFIQLILFFLLLLTSLVLFIHWARSFLIDLLIQVQIFIIKTLKIKVYFLIIHHFKWDLTTVTCLNCYIELWEVEFVIFNVESFLAEMHEDLAEAQISESFELRNVDQKHSLDAFWRMEDKSSTYFLSIC